MHDEIALDDESVALLKAQPHAFKPDEIDAFRSLYTQALTPPVPARQRPKDLPDGQPLPPLTHAEQQAIEAAEAQYLFLPMNAEFIQGYGMSHAGNVEVLLANMTPEDRSIMMSRDGRDAIIKRLQTKSKAGELRAVVYPGASPAKAAPGLRLVNPEGDEPLADFGPEIQKFLTEEMKLSSKEIAGLHDVYQTIIRSQLPRGGAQGEKAVVVLNGLNTMENVQIIMQNLNEKMWQDIIEGKADSVAERLITKLRLEAGQGAAPGAGHTANLKITGNYPETPVDPDAERALQELLLKGKAPVSGTWATRSTVKPGPAEGKGGRSGGGKAS